MTTLAVLVGAAMLFWDGTVSGDTGPAAAPSPSRTAPASTSSRPSASKSPKSRPFTGVPSVGALFGIDSDGRLGGHWCTGSVVHSPGRNLIITAAHCVGDSSQSGGLGLAFVPGYHDGKAPYGVWRAVRSFLDPRWTDSDDPDHDVGFMTVSKPGSNQRIEDVTGAETIATGQASGRARVIGYPMATEEPVSCENQFTPFKGAKQIKFVCPSFPDGTSGSPFLTGPDQNTVIGVIGGYQQGGDTDDVSYSVAFGTDVQNLYSTAASTAA